MMARWRKAARLWTWRQATVGLLLLAAGAQAQEPAAPLLTLDQDRFFLESDFGRASVERERAETATLAEENARIFDELAAEEQALTDQRKTLSPEEFSARAKAFDEKVERIRTEQDAKANRLVEQRDQVRTDFLALARPVLDELLSERQATAILDKRLVIISIPAIDITDEAIEKLNAELAQPDPEP